jgi:serine-type D-Ala-D-Ala carboxypeptidase/endopeptidase (penicillin-binding protein 4)
MNGKIFILIVGVLFFVFNSASAVKTMPSRKSSAYYSYIVGDVWGDHVSTKQGADAYVIPASCQKTIIALLAYKMFGADSRYETRLAVTEKNNKIHDVIISFSGDPTLTSDELVQLLSSLGNITIEGKIFLDLSLFKTPPYSPNVLPSDIGTDARPVSSANIDNNLITVKVRPNKAGGNFALVTNDAGYPTDSKITTSARISLVKLAVNNNRIYARGNIRRRHGAIELKISPIDLDYYLLQKIKLVMRRAKVKGEIVVVRDKSQLPAGLIQKDVNLSKPLGTIIPPALKISDNWIFDNLYIKIIHAEQTGIIEDWNNGSAIIKNLIYKYFNINVGDSVFVDGSGLSRYNKIQPRKLFEILKKGYGVTDFVEALPSPGERKSTLKRRRHLLEHIKAKTGNLNGVSCLCGYGINDNPKAFVIIAGGFKSPNHRIFPVMDKFVNYYVK